MTDLEILRMVFKQAKAYNGRMAFTFFVLFADVGGKWWKNKKVLLTPPGLDFWGKEE